MTHDYYVGTLDTRDSDWKLCADYVRIARVSAESWQFILPSRHGVDQILSDFEHFIFSTLSLRQCCFSCTRQSHPRLYFCILNWKNISNNVFTEKNSRKHSKTKHNFKKKQEWRLQRVFLLLHCPGLFIPHTQQDDQHKIRNTSNNSSSKHCPWRFLFRINSELLKEESIGSLHQQIGDW